jgi:hypothetical protein
MRTLPNGRIVALRCLGATEGPRFLDGRTDNGTVGLAPNIDPPFTGAKWLVDQAQGHVVLRCLGAVDGPRVLDGRTENGSVGLAPHTDAPFTGASWELIDSGGPGISLKCLGNIEGPRFLDGRTRDASVGLAPSNQPPFSGTYWDVIDLGGVPSEISFHANSIVFPEGIPVGGFADITLKQDGSVAYNFHFHDSGLPSYNVGSVWAVKDVAGRLYTVAVSGHTAGTGEAGSRNFDANNTVVNASVAQNWPAIACGLAKTTCNSRVDIDLDAIINDIKQAVGYIVQVIAIVG